MDSKVGYLLNQIEHKALTLPVFQREYVWSLDQAKQLITSLFKRYPTGSLLFWETVNPPQLKNLSGHPHPGSLLNVILDGQQRLTALYLLIKGQAPYYYDLSEIESHDPRDLHFNMETGEFKYENKIEMAANPLWIPVTEAFGNPPDPLTVALARVGSGNLSEAVELQKKLNANMNQLKGILEMDYPVQVVPNTADIDDAIRIFDLVNRQGTKLTEAELALAHMAGRWPEVRRILLDKLHALATKGYEFDLTFMVRCMTAVVTHRSEYEQIHSCSVEHLQAGWKKLNQVLDYLIDLLRSHAYIHSTDDLATPNVLVPIVTYLAEHDGKFAAAQERNHFLHWMYAALLGARYSAQTDQYLDKDIGIVLRSETPTADLEAEILKQRGRIEVKTGDLEGREIRNPIYRMAFIVAKSRGAVDWFTGTPLEAVGTKTPGANFYVFPWDRLQRRYESGNRLHKQQINEIANRVIMSKWPQVEYPANNPIEYLDAVEQKFPGSLYAYFIPKDRTLWHLDRYEDFLKARRQLIAGAINGFMKSLRQGASPEPAPDLKEIILGGETEQVEFKETLRRNLFTGAVEEKLREKAAREVAAFMNANGGILILGVRDDSTIVGVDQDIASFQSNPTEDAMQLWFQNIIKDRLGPEYLALLSTRFETVDGVRLFVVDVDPASMPVYYRDGSHGEFYVRLGTAAEKLDAKAAVGYISSHWNANG